ncbi:hypothetical protein Sjap_010836 [Stephania japonica]|uniref:Trimethylguanosine synthase n=1 Tax=Stephania japonica TaxID=461633 RepID=A0AAP0JA48_9MAGN
MKELVSKGMAAEVVAEVNSVDPDFFVQNGVVLFQIKQIEFLKLASSGVHSGALRVASTYLGHLAASNPTLLKPLKETLVTLLRSNEDALANSTPLTILATSFQADVVFLSSPWGGPSYENVKKFTLDLLKPKDGYSIFQIARKITPNIIMFLPHNVDLCQVKELAWLSYPPLPLEIEANYVQNNLKGITAYFGNTARASRLR